MKNSGQKLTLFFEYVFHALAHLMNVTAKNFSSLYAKGTMKVREIKKTRNTFFYS